MAPVSAKAPKEAKLKKTSTEPRKPRGYPPYYEMVNEAITALKERTGSSQIAIAKFIEEKQKANLPTNFKKLLLVQLKKFVANGKLVKVKNSFKLPPKSSATAATTTAAAVATKKSKSPSTSTVVKKPKSSSTTAAAKKTKTTSTKDAAKKPKSASTKDAKKLKSATTVAAAAKKRKASDAKVPAKKPKTDAKKAVAGTKAKKPKTIKSPVKKVAAKKAKK